MYQVNAKIDGMVEMMMDRFFNPEELEGAITKGKDAWKGQLPHKAYIDEKGVYVPSDNLRMMLIGNKLRPGSAKILGSYIEKNKATQYISFCEAHVWVIGPEVPRKVYIDPLRKTFDDYDERSFINATGSRSLTRRPLIAVPWSLSFIVQVTDDGYAPDKIKEFFIVAGLRCGVCAYGPTFGRFVVSAWNLAVPEESKHSQKKAKMVKV